jgi:hypothetical protein
VEAAHNKARLLVIKVFHEQRQNTYHLQRLHNMATTHHHHVGHTSHHFTTGDTGVKAADPYTKENADENVSLKDKVEDLMSFVEGIKFGIYLPPIRSPLRLRF